MKKSIIIFIMGLFLGAIALFIVQIVSLSTADQSSTTESSKHSLYTREEFKSSVMWKNKQDVINAVGKPNSTGEGGETEYWYYYGTTYDPITGKTNDQAQVCIENGIVKQVNFH